MTHICFKCAAKLVNYLITNNLRSNLEQERCGIQSGQFNYWCHIMVPIS